MTLIHRGSAFADDRVGELTKALSASSNEKTRLSAVVSLARLGDKRAMKPLVAALADPDSKIRAIAAVGLGKLGHKAALPALRSTATDDADPDVRNRARQATLAVAKANRLPDPFGSTTEPVTPTATSTVAAKRKSSRAGFGNQPRAIESHPDLYVMIKSSADDSPGRADKKTRKLHADIVRQTLAVQCKSAPNVTSLATDAQRWGLDLRNVDLSVTKMDVVQSGAYIEIAAELRLAISDDKGKMLSFLSGGAKVQVPKRTFNAKYLPNLRREALESAMRGMFDKLLKHLRDRSIT
ncbi:MAG: hypothetical protein H6Q90_3988 [Deltaproteobacteria bacterium]|nr:hypothetical protein [Deltaproteobacteria bacterium]